MPPAPMPTTETSRLVFPRRRRRETRSPALTMPAVSAAMKDTASLRLRRSRHSLPAMRAAVDVPTPASVSGRQLAPVHALAVSHCVSVARPARRYPLRLPSLSFSLGYDPGMRIASALVLAVGSLAALASMQACGSSSGGNAPPEGDAGGRIQLGKWLEFRLRQQLRREQRWKQLRKAAADRAAAPCPRRTSARSPSTCRAPWAGRARCARSPPSFYATPDAGVATAGCNGMQPAKLLLHGPARRRRRLPPGPT